MSPASPGEIRSLSALAGRFCQARGRRAAGSGCLVARVTAVAALAIARVLATVAALVGGGAGAVGRRVGRLVVGPGGVAVAVVAIAVVTGTIVAVAVVTGRVAGLAGRVAGLAGSATLVARLGLAGIAAAAGPGRAVSGRASALSRVAGAVLVYRRRVHRLRGCGLGS